MAIIRNISGQTGDGDKILSFSNEQIARGVSIGSSWSFIRLGVLYCISASAGSSNPDSISSPKLAFGLTAGTSSLVGNATTNHFVGLYVTASLTTWPNQLWYQSASNGISVKTGSTVLTYGNNSDITWFGRDSSGSFAIVRLVHYIDFIKSTTDPGNWTFIIQYNHTTTPPPGAIFPSTTSPAQFYSHLQEETSSLSVINHYTSSQFTAPISESANGLLDTVNIWWNKTDTNLQISDVAVFRFR